MLNAFGIQQSPPLFHFERVKEENHAEHTAFRDPRYSGGAGRPAASQGLHPGVKTDSKKNVLGIILAAAAAILCTIIDQVMKED
ncbi:hypothetical protein [Dysosmobacter welbionis]|uniref:hypothetical protein n=1 Tax=Dysosmobacter welbionis TaxID=2093857 RepID=UPI00307CB7C9